MAFKSYLIKQFEFPYENTYFRTLSNQLKTVFENSDGLNILIGNVSCNGHQMDALFIRGGQISVIDFKNYGGKLVLSENNPWSITNNGKIICVAGGNNIRNPFQQINAYRTSLIDHLDAKLNSILSANHSKFNLRHISGIVLFQQKIDFDKKEIPKNLIYFHVCDSDNIINLLADINSKSLFMDDLEINAVLKSLDITDENLYTVNLNDVSIPIIVSQNDLISEERLTHVKKILKNTILTSQAPTEESLTYYHTLLSVESIKDSELKSIFNTPFLIDLKADKIKIDYNLMNAGFLQLFERNKSNQFPDNLLIGLSFQVGDVDKILFSQIIEAADINFNEKFNIINSKDFELFNKSFLELNLPENIIDELSLSISNKDTLASKIDFLKSELDTLKIGKDTKIQIAFSSKSLTNSQLISELKFLKSTRISETKEGLINNFLLRTNILSNTNKSSLDTFVKITELNNEQETAVKACFENTLTVITGPPGTGKSQVVMNIIANAIVNDQKILFASKNNKAVDGVKERLENIINFKYLIRIGSKDLIRKELAIVFSDIINMINNKSFNHSDIDAQKIDLDQKNNRLKEIEATIAKIPTLKNQITTTEKQFSVLESDFLNFTSKLVQFEKLSFIVNDDFFQLNTNELDLLAYKIKKSNSNFIQRIIFNLFSKSATIKNITILEKGIPQSIIDYININKPLFVNSNTTFSSMSNHIEQLLEVYKLSQSLKIKKQKYTNDRLDFTNLLKSSNEELKYILSIQDKIKAESISIKKSLIPVSQSYLNSYISSKISKTPSSIINDYSSYIPDNIPWKSNELAAFNTCCDNILNHFKSIFVSNLSIKNGFPLSKEIFDILVIDEASQCDIASVIPLIFRAKKVVIIGDPLQLTHITNVKRYEEDYVSNFINFATNKHNYIKYSLFDYSNTLANDLSIPTYFLADHFRCQPQIIGFSNQNFYIPRMGKELNIKTSASNLDISDTGIFWYNVKGVVPIDININEIEAKQCISLSKQLLIKYPKASMGIITPFTNQKDFIQKNFSDIANFTNRIKVDTINKFQGDEKDIIILSLIVTKDSKKSLAGFINEYAPYLLNVAVTRARSALYIVGDFDYCMTCLSDRGLPTYLSKLAKYVELNGTVINI